MAKHRPPAREKATSSAASSTRPGSAPLAASVSPQPQSPAPMPPESGPQRRSTYFEAVSVYEKGLEALQRHDYHAAVELFESILRLYPEEKELHERARLYLNICQR